MGKISIGKLMEDDKLIVSLHPVISMRRRKIIGLEADCSLIVDGKHFDHESLKEFARKEKNLLYFERYCRKKSVEKFVSFTTKNPDFMQLVLFLSFESSLVDSGAVSSGSIINLANEYNLQPNRIALNINESNVKDNEGLKKFTVSHKEKGFIIVIDDVGSGSSNFERLTLVEPDIMNLNVSKIKPIEKEVYKRGVLRAMSGLAKSIGALVCCKGIESVGEAIICLDTGADLLAGKFFYDDSDDKEILKKELDEKIEILNKEFKAYLESKFNDSTRLLSEFNFIAGKMAHELTITSPDLYEKKMRSFLKINDSIEALYLLDINGIKLTETIFAAGRRAKNRKAIFKPSHIGTDHSSKNYYYNCVRSASGIYISEPYISGASGSLCITVSITFMNENAEKYILCIDFDSSIGVYNLSYFY